MRRWLSLLLVKWSEMEHDIVSILNNRQRHVTKLTYDYSHSSSRPNKLRGGAGKQSTRTHTHTPASVGRKASKHCCCAYRRCRFLLSLYLDLGRRVVFTLSTVVYMYVSSARWLRANANNCIGRHFTPAPTTCWATCRRSVTKTSALKGFEPHSFVGPLQWFAQT